MWRTNDHLMFLLIGLATIIMIVVILQRPLDSLLILVGCGIALFTFAWTGMYFVLKREQPEHTLVGASYLNLPIGWAATAAPVPATCSASFNSISSVTGSTTGRCCWRSGSQ